MKPAYILGSGAISPQRSWESLFESNQNTQSDKLLCAEPEYSQYIDPKHLRRMSRILKMGTAASAMALKEANVPMPDGIITGTAYGCLEDTGTFMRKLLDQNEYALSPTPFIQSTHNTIGSQIALLLQCQGYNQTYTQEAFSFEASLLDTLLSLDENPDQTILTGGVDEITDASHEIQKRFGIYGITTPHGEGAFYFTLSGNKEKTTAASLSGVATFFNPSKDKLSNGIENFLASNSISKEEVNLLLLGDGHHKIEGLDLNNIIESALPGIPAGAFKHLSGEYPTASAFAFWLGIKIIETQKIPTTVLNTKFGKPVKNILIINSWFGISYSLILLKAC